jgi:4-hydroxy-3-methylbut-2-enyl diphosphate reductase
MRLRQRGVVFVDQLDSVPDNARVMFSAHGVPKSVRSESKRRGLKYLDATCPLVTKVHREVEHHVAAARHVIVIGHRNHAR